MIKNRYLVSACLAGLATRYDGSSCPNAKVQALVSGGLAVPVCPEQLGGLPTPRTPAEIQGGDGADVWRNKARVISQEGLDVTQEHIRGAKQVLAIAKLFGAGKAILKAKSPACGVSKIYDGSFSGALKAGDGVTAALLRSEKLQLFTEDNLGDD